MKLYHWANILLNPLIVIGISVIQWAKIDVPEPTQNYLIIGCGAWIIFGCIFNPILRGWLAKFLSAIFGVGISLGAIGGFGAIIMLIFVVGILALAGFVGGAIALIYLWITSIAALKTMGETTLFP